MNGFITSGLMVGWCVCIVSDLGMICEWVVNGFCVVCTNLVVASWVVCLVV